MRLYEFPGDIVGNTGRESRQRNRRAISSDDLMQRAGIALRRGHIARRSWIGRFERFNAGDNSTLDVSALARCPLRKSGVALP